jgi:hypothetical protein
VDETFPTYFRRHLDQIGECDSRAPDHVLIETGDWSGHPLFSP